MIARRGWARIQGRSKSVERFGSQGLETSRTFSAASIDFSEIEHFALARRPVLIVAQPRRANLPQYLILIFGISLDTDPKSEAYSARPALVARGVRVVTDALQ